MTLFKLVHTSIEDKYLEAFGRSPVKELACCLKLQQEVITGIAYTPDEKTISSITPGHIEIPPPTFWEKASSFYLNFQPENSVNEEFLKNYSVEFKEEPTGSLAPQATYDSQYLSENIHGLFVNHNGRYYLLFPRRATPVIFDKWASIYEKIFKKGVIVRDNLKIKIGASVNNFIKNRINQNNVYSCFSALREDGKCHDIIFPVCFISKNKLILCYIVSPFFNSEANAEELHEINNSLQEAVKFLSKSPLTLALHLEKQNVEFHPKFMGEKLSVELFVLIPQVTSWFSLGKIPENLPGRLLFLDQFLGIIDELDGAETFAEFLEYHDLHEEKFLGKVEMLASFASFKDSMGTLIEGAGELDMIGQILTGAQAYAIKHLKIFGEFTLKKAISMTQEHGMSPEKQ